MALVFEGYLYQGYKWCKENLKFNEHYQGTRSPNQASLNIDLRKISDDVYVSKVEPKVRITITKIRG